MADKLASHFIYFVSEKCQDDRYFLLENDNHGYGNNHENCLRLFENLVRDSEGELTFQVFDSVDPAIKDQLESFTEFKLYLAERLLGLR